jgi:SanA protein
MINKMFIIKILLFISLSLFLVVFLSNFWVSNDNKEKIYDDINKIPKNKVGLVLGTVKYLENNRINLYFTYRMDAAEKLYKSGKIKYLIVSGDNSRDGYNEPEDMKKDLIKRGIPEKNIYQDFAGFRTFDSVIRAKEIFEQDQFTIISQKFHNERANFIAKKNSINTIAFNAKDVNSISSLRVKIREYFARVKVVLDIYILNTKPIFLGNKIKIN